MRWPRFTILQLFLVTALAGLLVGWWMQAQRASLRSTLRGVELSPDGKRLAELYELGNIDVWDVSGERARLMRSRRYGQNFVFGLRFVENGTVVVFQMNQGSPELIAWNIATGKERVAVRLPGLGVFDASRDGTVASTVSFPSATPAGPTIDLWDLNGGKLIRQVAIANIDHVREVLISDDGRLIAAFVISGGGWGEVHVFDTRTGQCVVSLTDVSPFQYPTLSGDGHTLALFGRRDYRIRIFDLTKPSLEPVAVVEMSPRSMQLSRDGSRLMAIDERTVAVWDVTSKTQLWTDQLDSEVFHDTEGLVGLPHLMSADGSRIAIPSSDGEIHILDAATGQRLMTIGGTHRLRDFLLYSTAFLLWAVAWGLVSRREKLRQPAGRLAGFALPLRFYTLSVRQALLVLVAFLGVLCAALAWLLHSLMAGFSAIRPGWSHFAPLFAAVFGLVCGVLYLRLRFLPLWGSLRVAQRIVGNTGRRQRHGRITGLFAGESTIEHTFRAHIEEIRQKLAVLLGREAPIQREMLVIGLERTDDYFLLNRTRLPHGGIVLTHLFADECRVCEELAHRDGTIATVMLRATIALALLRRHWRANAPVWISSVVSTYLAADEQWPASLKRAHRMLAGILGDDATNVCRDLLTMPLATRYQQVLQKDDPAIFRGLALTQAVTVLLAEFLLGDHDGSPRDKMLEVLRSVGRRRDIEGACQRVFGHRAADLAEPWWAWVRQQPLGPFEPPPEEARWAIASLTASIRRAGAHPLVEQQRNVSVLGAAGDLAAVPTLLAILENSESPLRAEALWAIRGLSGQQWDDDPPKWRAWWEEVEPQSAATSGPQRDELVQADLATATAESPRAEQPHEPWQLAIARLAIGAGGVWGIIYAVALSFCLNGLYGALVLMPAIGFTLVVGLLATARAAGRHWWGLRFCTRLQMAALIGCDPVQSLAGIVAAIMLRGSAVQRYLQRVGGN